jgi:hypothetical protein
MKFYVEAWSAKQAWLDLSAEERGAYMGQVDFFAVWKFPTDELAKSFEALVTGAGWYNYFTQVNLKGNAGGPEEIIGKMINM